MKLKKFPIPAFHEKNRISTSIESTKQHNRHRQFWEFAAIASVPMVLVLGNSMLVPILPELQQQLNVTRFQSSLIISLFSLTAGIVIPISGYLSDRFSRKAILIPSLMIYGGAGVLAAFGAMWNSYFILMIARIIQGIGAAGTAPIAMAYIGDAYQGSTESKALGLIEASNGVGKVLSPILGSLLAIWVWYAPFFAFPIFCAIALIAVMFILKEPKKSQTPPKLSIYLKQIGSTLNQKGRWLITSFFAGSLALFILFGVLFYLSNILEAKPYEIQGLKKGLVLAIPLLGLVITSYTTGVFIKKNGTLMRWLMNIGLVLLTGTLLLNIFFYQTLWILVGLLTISGVGTGLLLPCLNSIITGSVEKAQRGTITSLYSSLRFIGVAFGPPVFEYLMKISDQMVFISISLLAFIAFLLIFFLVKPAGKIS
jgi:ACDE family multidrug resistance protein